MITQDQLPKGAREMARIDIYPEASFSEWIGHCGITRSACWRTSTALVPDQITLVADPALSELKAIRGVHLSTQLAYEATGANFVTDTWEWTAGA